MVYLRGLRPEEKGAGLKLDIHKQWENRESQRSVYTVRVEATGSANHLGVLIEDEETFPGPSEASRSVPGLRREC
jgi:hypothetical protein